MSASPERESTFVCDCRPLSRLACYQESFYAEHQGKRFCVLHFPGRKDNAEFNKSVQRKLSDWNLDFSEVWFPERLNFKVFRFAKEAQFSYATFAKEVDFSFSSFSGEADFSNATFNKYADFRLAIFNGNANFLSAKFLGDADFRFSVFRAEADFMNATFQDYLLFALGEHSPVFPIGASLSLQFARMVNPAHVSFHSLALQPHWFVNVDPHEFEFTNVHWLDLNIEKELELLQGKNVLASSRMLSIAYRHLAVNAEENHRYEEASRFRYMAMDAPRYQQWRKTPLWKLNFWYWLASGYGERALKAFAWLLGIWLSCALLYTQVGFERRLSKQPNERDASLSLNEEDAPLGLTRSLVYSASVMTLQKPEPRPATTLAQTSVLLETILGPVQAALLALAIRRKFMR